MSKRAFELIVCITGAVCGVAIGLVTYFNPPYATAINDSIQILETAVIAICGNFAINTANKNKLK